MTRIVPEEETRALSPLARSSWRVLGRRWLWFAAAVLVDALVQALLVAVDLTPRIDAEFLVLLVLAILAAGATLSVIAAAATSGALGVRTRIRFTTVLAGFVVAVLTIVAATTQIVLGVAVAVLGMLVLPMIDASSTLDEAAERFLGLRHAPFHAAGWIVADVALIGLAWLASFHAAFFVAGAYAAFVSWITIGLAVVMMQCGAGALLARVERRRAAAQEAPPPIPEEARSADTPVPE